jgi:hypothetical protein
LLVTAFVVLHASETAARGDDPPMPTTPSALERSADGWVDLLAAAGPELKGWTRASIPPGRPIDPSKPSQWSYDPEKRILTCRGDGGHDWIRWDEELGDAVFHVEWRFVPVEGKSRYNSGVYARNSADAKVWHQAQTGDGSGGFLFGDTPVEGKLQRFKPSYKAKDGRVKPAGEWNTYEITCKGREMSLWSNGAVTCVFDACDVPRGYVGLEAEGYLIEFRNVKVKKLDR